MRARWLKLTRCRADNMYSVKWNQVRLQDPLLFQIWAENGSDLLRPRLISVRFCCLGCDFKRTTRERD